MLQLHDSGVFRIKIEERAGKLYKLLQERESQRIELKHVTGHTFTWLKDTRDDMLEARIVCGTGDTTEALLDEARENDTSDPEVAREVVDREERASHGVVAELWSWRLRPGFDITSDTFLSSVPSRLSKRALDSQLQSTTTLQSVFFSQILGQTGFRMFCTTKPCNCTFALQSAIYTWDSSLMPTLS